MSKTVFISGAGSGIGWAILEHFASSNHNVVAHCHSAESLDRLQSFKTKNPNVKIVKADLSKPQEIKSMVQEVKPPDILINNSGIYTHSADFESIPLSDLEQVMQVNFYAPFQLIQWALPSMKQNGWGRIINISSIGVKYGGSSQSAPYTCSKAALETLTKNLSKTLAKENILINALRVGVTNTKFHEKNPGKDLHARTKMIPMGRMAEPSEISSFVGFLASDNNTYTTGAIIPVSGGE